MKSVTQHIRARLEATLPQRPTLAVLRRTEWSRTFVRLMKNRLIMGAFRYGLMETKDEQGYDMLGSMARRIEMYRKSGNLEFLVDIANLALLEFEHPSLPHAHFSPEDDGEHCR